MIVVVVIMIMVIAVIVIMPLVLLMPLLATHLVPLLLANNVLLMPQLFVPQRLLALVFMGTDVSRLIFPGLHKIHLPVAGVILVTMQPPIPGMIGRNMQIKRRRHDNIRRRLLDDDGPRVDQRWRRPATDVHATIDAWRYFTANRHSNIHIRMGGTGS